MFVFNEEEMCLVKSLGVGMNILLFAYNIETHGCDMLALTIRWFLDLINLH